MQHFWIRDYSHQPKIWLGKLLQQPIIVNLKYQRLMQKRLNIPHLGSKNGMFLTKRLYQDKRNRSRWMLHQSPQHSDANNMDKTSKIGNSGVYRLKLSTSEYATIPPLHKMHWSSTFSMSNGRVCRKATCFLTSSSFRSLSFWTSASNSIV